VNIRDCKQHGERRVSNAVTIFKIKIENPDYFVRIGQDRNRDLGLLIDCELFLQQLLDDIG